MSYQSRKDLNLPYKPAKWGFSKKDTLDTLENDESYIEVAQRFLSSIGEDDQQVDDVYEYMRDEEWNLGSSAKRTFMDMPTWTDQQKNDYKYLQRRFENADMGGFSQYAKFVADAGIDLATDPLTLASILAAPVTGGASIFANRGLAQATKMGLKKVGKTFKQDKPLLGVVKKEKLTEKLPTGEIDWKLTMSKNKAARQDAVKQYYSGQVKDNALFGFAEGAIWTGMDEYLRQERQSMEGIDIRDGLNLYDIGTTTLLGGVLGSAVGGALTKGINSPRFSEEARENLTKYSDEVFVDENSLGFKASKVKDTIISKTIGKPVTRFLTMAESSEPFQDLLTMFRYDTYKFKSSKGVGSLKTSYNELLNNFNGKYHQQYEQLIKPFAPKGKISKEDELILSRLMRRKERGEALSKVKIKGATATHIEVADKISMLADTVLKDGNSQGIYRQPLRNGPNAWFPRRWLWDQVEQGRDELAQIMIKSNAVSLDDNVVFDLLPSGIEKDKFKQLTNITDAYEELLLGLPNKNVADLESFIKTIAERYDSPDVSKTYEEILLRMNKKKDKPIETMSLEFGKLLQNVAKEKKQIELLIPETPELKRQQLSVANNIITDMLSKKNQVNTLDIETLGTVMPSSFSPRKLFMLDDFEIEKFIAHDFDTLMRDYFNQSSRLYARTATLGSNITDFTNRWIRPIEKDLADKGITLTNGDKEELANLYNFTTGLDNSSFGTNGLNNVADTIKISQQLAHLPLVTLSSLTEIFIPLTRTSVNTWAKGMGQTIKFAVQKQSDATLRELQDRYDLSKEEALSEMHRVFLGINQAVAQRIDGLAGEGVQSVVGKKIQDKFFKVNLLEQWTRTVQLASFTMGKDMITRNLKKIVELENTPNALDKKQIDRLSQELLDLGVDIKTGTEWVKAGAKRYSDTTNEITGLRNWSTFYENYVMQGAARFTNEVILDPSKASSIRPHAQQTPTGSVLFQFLGYPTAFSNTVLKNFYGQAARNPVRGGGKILGTGLLMTAAAAGTNWIRNGGSFEDYKGEEQEPEQIAWEAVQRWGGVGFLDYAERARENAEIGGGFLGSTVKAVTGPIVGDAIDGLIYRKGPGELLATNVPGYSLYRSFPSAFENTNLKKDIQRGGQNIDIAIGYKPERKKQSLEAYLNSTSRSMDKASFFEGGSIFEDVPKTASNPSGRIDRTTGVSYSDQSGDILVNRERFNVGSLAKLLKGTGKTISNTFKDFYEGSPQAIGVEEQKNIIDTFVKESKVKDPLYISQSPNGLFYAQQKPFSSLTEGVRGHVRSLNPFVYKGVFPLVDSPTELLMNKELIEETSKTDALLGKRLDAIGKDYARTLGLGFINNFKQEADNSRFLGETDERALTVNYDKEIIEAFKKAGYDAIEYKASEKDSAPLNVLEETIETSERAPTRTAGQRLGASVDTLLAEADKQFPGFRAEYDTRGASVIEAVDEVPEEANVPYDVPTTIYDVENLDVESASVANRSWLLLDDTMYLENNLIPILDTDSIESFNKQFTDEEKIDFIDSVRINFGLSDEKFKNDLLKGPYNLVTTLIPTEDSFLPSKVLTIEQATPARLEALQGELNLNDESQKSFYDSIVTQLVEQEKLLEVDELAPPLFFVTELLTGQESKYLSEDTSKLLTAPLMTAFIKSRQKKNPAEFLHHPEDNNIRSETAKVFSSLYPPNISVEQAKEAAADYLSKVKITKEKPYTAGTYIEDFKEAKKARDRLDEMRGADDEELGIIGTKKSDELEDYSEFSQARVKRGPKGVLYIEQPNGEKLQVVKDPEVFSVMQQQKNKEGTLLFNNQNKPLMKRVYLKEENFSALYPEEYMKIKDKLDDYAYVKDEEGQNIEVDITKRNTKKRKKKKVSKAKAKFKQPQPTPATPAITEELPMLRRMTEASERIKTLPAFKEADPIQQKRILNLIDKYQKSGKR